MNGKIQKHRKRGATGTSPNARLEPKLSPLAHRLKPVDRYYGICQSSINSPATRLNSAALCVTRMSEWAIVIAAIIKSFGPISCPRAVKSARMVA